jgi:calcineurin-like phosphoesterase
MTTSSLKLEIEKALKKTQSQVILELIYSILNGENAPIGKRITRKQYNKEIQYSLSQAKKGKVLIINSF